MWKVSFFLLLFFLFILLGIVFWLVPKGYIKAVTLGPQLKAFETRQTINVQLSGVLEQKSSNSWTLGKDGRKITVTNESQHPPGYIRRPNQSSQQTEIIDSSEVSLDAPVAISLSIDPQSGKLTVMNIIVE